jgi:hypothetical protein
MQEVVEVEGIPMVVRVPREAREVQEVAGRADQEGMDRTRQQTRAAEVAEGQETDLPMQMVEMEAPALSSFRTRPTKHRTILAAVPPPLPVPIRSVRTLPAERLR